jgi:DNA-binding beta-propeller fold protein YncE
MDPSTGRIFVADTGNGRVLSWSNTHRLTNSETADLALGQGVQPFGIAVDNEGRAYAAEPNRHRVVRFSPPLSNGQPPDLVLGGADPASVGCLDSSDPGPPTNPVSLGAASICFPYDVAVDGAGRLWVPDTTSHRILRFRPPLTNGQAADLVLGQADFTGRDCNTTGFNAGGISAPTLPTHRSSNGFCWRALGRRYH